MLPLSRVRGGETYRWIDEVVRLRKDDDPERVRSLLYDVQQAYVEPLIRYAFPVTELPESVELEAVCSIFETLNRTGKPLTTFELISARAFSSGLSLRDFWNSAVERHPILEDFEIDPVYVLAGHRPARRRAMQAQHHPAACRRSHRARMGHRGRRHGSRPRHAAQPMRRARQQVAPLPSDADPDGRRMARDCHRARPRAGRRRAKLIQWFWCASFTGEYESSSATLAERDSPDPPRLAQRRRAATGGREPSLGTRNGGGTLPSRQQGLYKATMALIREPGPSRSSHRRTADRRTHQREKDRRPPRLPRGLPARHRPRPRRPTPSSTTC